VRDHRVSLPEPSPGRRLNSDISGPAAGCVGLWQHGRRPPRGLPFGRREVSVYAQAVADDRGRRRALQVGWLALGAVAVLCACYAGLSLTARGQLVDDQALFGWFAAPAALRARLPQVLTRVDVTTVALMAVLLVVTATVRRQVLPALVAGATLGAAAGSAEVLKYVLPRPEHAEDATAAVYGKGLNTFPSGHATLATAVVLGLVLVVSNRWRPLVGMLGVVWASVVAAGTGAAFLHRPGDAIGGLALAACWVAAGTALLYRRRGVRVRAARMAAVPPLVAVGVVVVAAVLVASSLARTSVTLPMATPSWLFAVSQIVVGLVAVGTVGTFAWLLRDVDVSRPVRQRPRVKARVSATTVQLR
jgi:membrane-associated phospholipid phosphatase